MGWISGSRVSQGVGPTEPGVLASRAESEESADPPYTPQPFLSPERAALVTSSGQKKGEL